MRNLKKFLALALAVMMVFSLMVTVNAAGPENSTDKFPDAGELSNSYKKAMNFLVELKVFKGRDLDADGEETLDPKETLTRAEYVAVLYMISTGDTAKPGESKSALLNAMKDYGDYYFDDVKSNWAVEYINYAASMGWVQGDGNRHFNPNYPVSTYEVLLGMLHVIGLGKDIKGADWQIKTAQLAHSDDVKIDSGVETFSGAATRELTAQITFNTLFAQGEDEVTHTYFVVSLSKKFDGAITTAKALATPVVINSAGYTTEDAAIAAARAVAKAANVDVTYLEDYTIVERDVITKKGSLSDTAFGLSTASGGKSDHDEYGRPLTVYLKKNGTEAATIYDIPMLTSDETGPDLYLTGQYLYDKLGHNAVVTVRTTGIDKATPDEDGEGYTTTLYKPVDGNNKVNSVGLGGNGVHVEIYKKDIASTPQVEYVAVVIEPAFGKVTNVRSYKETPSSSAYTEYTVEVNNVSYTMVNYPDPKNASEESTVFVDGTVARNDYVLIDTEWGVSYVTYEFVPNYVLTPVTKVEGTITAYSKSGVYTIGGKSYTESGIVGAKALNVNGEFHTFALDGQGNVVDQLPDGTVAADYIFVLDAEKASYLNTTTNKVEDVIEVTGINQNGELTTLKVSSYKNSGAAAQSVTGANASVQGYLDALKTTKQIWTYSYNRYNGLYDLVNKNGLGVGVVKNSITNSTGDYVKIQDKTTLVSAADASAGSITPMYANAKTKYFVAVYDDNAGKYTGVTAYTGYAAIDNITSVAGYASLAISIIDVENDGIAEVVFVENYGASLNAYAYVMDKANVTEDGTYIYDAYINGEWTTLEHRGPIGTTLPALVQIANGMAYKLQNTAGKIEDATKTSTLVYLNNTDTFTYSGGLLMLDDPNGGNGTVLIDEVDKDVPVYIFRNNVATELTAEDLVNDGGTWVVFVSDGTKVVAIYIVEDATPDSSFRFPGSTGPDPVEVPELSSGMDYEMSDTDDVKVDGNVEAGATVKMAAGAKLTVDGDIEEGAIITVAEGATLTVNGEIKKGAVIVVADPSDIELGEDAEVNEAVQVVPTDPKVGLGLTTTTGLADLLTEGVIYSVSKSDLAGTTGVASLDDDAGLFTAPAGETLNDDAVLVVKYGTEVGRLDEAAVVSDDAIVITVTNTGTGAVVWTNDVANTGTAPDATAGNATPGNIPSGGGSTGAAGHTDLFGLNLQFPASTKAGQGTGTLSTGFVKGTRYTITIKKGSSTLFKGSFTAPVSTNADWLKKATATTPTT